MKKSKGFSEGLRRAMRLNDCTIKRLAKDLGVSKATVQNWRTGTIPNFQNAAKLAIRLRCSLDSLIEGEAVSPLELKYYENAPVDTIPAHVAKAMGLIRSGVQEKLLRKMGVDNVRKSEYCPIVISDIKTLMDCVRKLTSERGARAALAKELKVSPSSLTEWLSGVSAPDGENTLKLHNWVMKRMSL